jgi:hypothetical protein
MVLHAKDCYQKNVSDGAKGTKVTSSNNYSINKVYPAVMVVKAGCVSMSCLARKSNMQ